MVWLVHDLVRSIDKVSLSDEGQNCSWQKLIMGSHTRGVEKVPVYHLPDISPINV
jgi:hypothetical protein